MKQFLKLGEYSQVVAVSRYNTKKVPNTEGLIDITDVEVPQDIEHNPQNWTFENGAFRQFTPEEKAQHDFPDWMYWRRLRSERNKRLAACDWTQVPDAPVDHAAWATYRQELRELPEHTVDPRNPVWPTPPE